MAEGDPVNAAWSVIVRMAEVPSAGAVHALSAGDAERARLARDLDLMSLDHLEAEVRLKPWFDGVEVSGVWNARFGQACGVTLERLEQSLSGDFLVRLVPEGSIHAPSEDQLVEFDPDAIDPPEVSPDGNVDIAGLVVEHFALEIDPFPRKEGVEFVQPGGNPELSPFAVLQRLRRED
jgi:hypothetical protein